MTRCRTRSEDIVRMGCRDGRWSQFRCRHAFRYGDSQKPRRGCWPMAKGFGFAEVGVQNAQMLASVDEAQTSSLSGENHARPSRRMAEPVVVKDVKPNRIVDVSRRGRDGELIPSLSCLLASQ